VCVCPLPLPLPLTLTYIYQVYKSIIQLSEFWRPGTFFVPFSARTLAEHFLIPDSQAVITFFILLFRTTLSQENGIRKDVMKLKWKAHA
jgi:hypothetical protein